MLLGIHAIPTYLRNHAPRPNDRAPPDSYPGQDARPAADPHVLAHVNLRSGLGARRPPPHRCVERVRAGVEADTGADERARPDAHPARVDKHGVMVHKRPRRDVELRAVVGT